MSEETTRIAERALRARTAAEAKAILLELDYDGGPARPLTSRDVETARRAARVRFERQVVEATPRELAEIKRSSWDVRVAYRKLELPDLESTQDLFQGPAGMRTGLVYDFQRSPGRSTRVRWPVIWYFEDRDFNLTYPFQVPDSGVARGVCVSFRALHERLTTAGEPFFICGSGANAIARCELVEWAPTEEA